MKLLANPVVFILALFFSVVVSCKKDSDKPVITIEGFDLTDASGVPMGHSGPEDNDWTFNNTLTDRELALFNFSTSYTLDNTTEATINGNKIVAYPNPCSEVQSYQVTASDSVLLKAVVVNNKMEVLSKVAMKLKGSSGFYISYHDSQAFPNKLAVRMYFSFSAQNKPNYKVGYGDIKICRSSGSSDDCFK